MAFETHLSNEALLLVAFMF